MPQHPDGISAPRFTGIPSFMRTPFVEKIQNLDIAMAGVPYDGGVTNRPGARHGPREIRNQSSFMRGIHHVSKINPFEICRVADVGDVPFEASHIPDLAAIEIENFFREIHEAGALPLTAGGNHSITYPIFCAISSSDAPIGMVHIDAHTDTWDSWQGNKFNHGAPFRRAVESGVLDPSRTIQIGIRGPQNVHDGWNFSLNNGMRVIFIEEFSDLGVDGVVAEALRVVGSGPTYISFDIDSLDPAYAPGTGTPEIGGITTIEAQKLLRGLRGLNLIGGDVVEVSPPFDQSGNTALVGATIMFEILCLLAEVVSSKK